MPDYSGAVARTADGILGIKLKLGEVPSLLDWNSASGKGTTDDTSVINQAIAQAPRGGCVHVPKGVYVHTGNLVLPNKPLTFYGDGARMPNNWFQRVGSPVTPVPGDTATLGSWIWNSASNQHFNPATLVDSQISFRNLGFFGGTGVIKVGNLNTTLNFNIENVVAMFCSSTAFELGADDTGNSQFFHFLRCYFYNNGIDILQHVNCDVIIQNSVFQDNHTRAIELRGANARVSDNTIWGNTGSNAEDILVYPTSSNPLAGATYNQKICWNKFGNEDSVVAETRVKIRIGTSAQKAAHPDYYVADLEISSNEFIGTQDANAAISLHSPLLNSRIHHNQFFSTIYAIDDSDATESEVGGNNQYLANQHFNGTLPFKSSGKTFGIIGDIDYGAPKATSQANDEPLQPVENLLSYSEDFNSWSKFAVTVTSGFSDPLGGSLARKLAKSATAGAVVTLGFTTTFDGPISYSVWMKAGTAGLAVVEIVNSGATVTYVRQIVGLDTVWRRYTLRLSHMSAADSGRSVRIYPGNFSAAVACDIYAFGAQVNTGDQAAGYMRTTGSVVTNSLGMRVPLDMSIGRDLQVERWVIDHLSLLGTNGHLDLFQTSTGVAYRLTLNNDGTLRLQYSTNGFSSLAATPLLWTGASLSVGNAVSFADTVSLAGRTNSRLLSIDGSGNVVVLKLSPTDANYIDPGGLTDGHLVKRSGTVLASVSSAPSDAELGYLVGVTSAIQTQLNAKAPTTGINATAISSGSVDNTEFDYLDGVTSGIQTQLDALSSRISAIESAMSTAGNHSATLAKLTGGGSNGGFNVTQGLVDSVINPT